VSEENLALLSSLGLCRVKRLRKVKVEELHLSEAEELAQPHVEN